MMESSHLVSVLLLLLVASSRSQENITDWEDATTPVESFPLSSTGSPSVQQLESETESSSALPNGVSTPVATEVITSQKPTTMSNSVASATTVMEDFKVRIEPSTTSLTSGSNAQSTTLNSIDMVTIPSRDNVDGSESLTDDQSTANPSTIRNETDSRDDDGYVTLETDGEKGRDEDVPTTKHPGQETNKDVTDQKKPKNKGLGSVILIGVIIFVLILLLVIIVFFMLRKKKRSGSFRTQSKRNARQDVWAGQVPELGDVRAAQELAMVENGRAGTKLEAVKEEEMTTFVTGEKKVDSATEMNELGAGEKAKENGGEKLGKGDTEEEKTPLLEEASEESPKDDEQFPVPPMEQELMANGVQ